MGWEREEYFVSGCDSKLGRRLITPSVVSAQAGIQAEVEFVTTFSAILNTVTTPLILAGGSPAARGIDIVNTV
jgi:hypothetical protein